MHAPMSSQILPIRVLCEISTADLAYAGGKGAHLGQLTRTGLPVPPGFVIGAPVYAAFRVRSGLAGHLQTLLRGLDVEDGAALEQAAGEARRLVRESELPDWLEGEIGTAHRWLAGVEADTAVAVRSSGVAADPASAWLASVNKTYLNAQGLAAVIDGVRRCWMSLFNAETIRYRHDRGLGPGDIDIAVIVQLQISATREGRMFTSDPATHVREQMVIEGRRGFADSLAPGGLVSAARPQAACDRYVVDKRRMSAVPGLGGDRLVLTDDEVFRLAELGVAIEREFHSPQDIEWVFDPDGRIWLLQSRPLLLQAAPS